MPALGRRAVRWTGPEGRGVPHPPPPRRGGAGAAGGQSRGASAGGGGAVGLEAGAGARHLRRRGVRGAAAPLPSLSFRRLRALGPGRGGRRWRSRCAAASTWTGGVSGTTWRRAAATARSWTRAATGSGPARCSSTGGRWAPSGFRQPRGARERTAGSPFPSFCVRGCLPRSGGGGYGAGARLSAAVGELCGPLRRRRERGASGRESAGRKTGWVRGGRPWDGMGWDGSRGNAAEVRIHVCLPARQRRPALFPNRWLTCRSLPPGALERIADTVADRCRVPWFSGAVKINVSLVPPMVLLPVFLHIAALHFLLGLVVLTSLPAVVLWYYYLTHRRKERTLFFLSLGLFSLGYMYYVFLQEVVPRGHVGYSQVTLLTCGLILMLAALSRAKKDPGYLPISAGDDRPSQQAFPNKNVRGSSNGLHGAAASGHSVNGETKGYSRVLAEEREGVKMDWCAKCQLVRPARAGHCRLCGRCVRRLDHHCVWYVWLC